MSKACQFNSSPKKNNKALILFSQNCENKLNFFRGSKDFRNTIVPLSILLKTSSEFAVSVQTYGAADLNQDQWRGNIQFGLQKYKTMTRRFIRRRHTILSDSHSSHLVAWHWPRMCPSASPERAPHLSSTPGTARGQRTPAEEEENTLNTEAQYW